MKVNALGVLITDTKSNLKLAGFGSQLEESCVSYHIERLWYNKIVCMGINIYIYIYIYIVAYILRLYLS